MGTTRAITWLLTCAAVGCGGVPQAGPTTTGARSGAQATDATSVATAPELARDPRGLPAVTVPWQLERPAHWMGAGWAMDEIVTQTYDCGATLVTRQATSLTGLEPSSGQPRWQRELDVGPTYEDHGDGQYVAAGGGRVVSVAASDGSTRWQVAPREASIEGVHVVACAKGPCDVLLEVRAYPPLPRRTSSPRMMPTAGGPALVRLSGADGSERWRRPCSNCDVVEASTESIVVRDHRGELQRLDSEGRPVATAVRLAPGQLLLRLADGGVVLDGGALRRVALDGTERWALPLDARLGALPWPGPRGARLDARRAFVVLDRLGWTPRGREVMAKLGVWLDVETGAALAAGWLPGDVFQVFGAGGRVSVGTPQWLASVAPPAPGAGSAAGRPAAEVLELALGTARGFAHVSAAETARPGRFPYETRGALVLLDADGGALARQSAAKLLAGVHADLRAGTPEALERAGRRLRALGRWLPSDAAEALAADVIAVQPPLDTAAAMHAELETRKLMLARQDVRAQAFAVVERSVASADALLRLSASAGWGDAPTVSACEELSAQDVGALWALMRHLHLTQPQRHTHVPQLPCIPPGHVPPHTRLHATLEAYRRLERVQLARDARGLEVVSRGDARWDAAPARVFEVDDGRPYHPRVVRTFVVRRVDDAWRVTDLEERHGADSVLLLQ